MASTDRPRAQRAAYKAVLGITGMAEPEMLEVKRFMALEVCSYVALIGTKMHTKS